KHVSDALEILKAANYDLIILETSGIGQSDTEILDHSDVSLYVMTPEYGAATQLEKIDMIDFADVIALNKFDKKGSLDALRDVKKQYQRNHNLWDKKIEDMPVFGTIASQFNDPGTNNLYSFIISLINNKTSAKLNSTFEISEAMSEKQFIIPPKRVRYLSEITENNHTYDDWSKKQSKIAQSLYGIFKVIETFAKENISLNHIGIEEKKLKIESDNKEIINQLLIEFSNIKKDLDPHNWDIILNFDNKKQSYKDDIFTFKVRDKEIKIKTHIESLSHLKIPKITLPKYEAWGDLLLWTLQENVPGEFPFTAGIYPFKRTGEDPTRMFAGEGGPERTNRRFHYVSLDAPAKRLSTAFDSVTLYGNDPDLRPDIYGKIGNAGVSICCLDDAKKLYSGFDLTNPLTSVSMTINGPAPMMLGYFMNTAIDQECEKYIIEHQLEKEINAKIKDIYSKKDVVIPSYQGKLPEGNNGLGLMLLGVTGDEILPND
ncbi:MAG: methylmalonyl-CoA mutase, partial [Flavobacteriaceae bacterium]|nr:methylmalonyl-CoA mutase [Flavobacteriaceae bacterium]